MNSFFWNVAIGMRKNILIQFNRLEIILRSIINQEIYTSWIKYNNHVSSTFHTAHFLFCRYFKYLFVFYIRCVSTTRKTFWSVIDAAVKSRNFYYQKKEKTSKKENDPDQMLECEICNQLKSWEFRLLESRTLQNVLL